MEFRPRVYPELLATKKARLIALSDMEPAFRDGDMLTSLLELNSLDDDEQYTQMVRLLRSRFTDNARGEDLDRFGRVFGLFRRQALQAIVDSIVLVRNFTSTPSGELTATAGTVLQIPGTPLASAVEYTLDADLAIPSRNLDLGGPPSIPIGTITFDVDATFEIPSLLFSKALIDPGGVNEELVVVQSVVGTTVTLANPTAVLHLDGEELALPFSPEGNATAVLPGESGNAAVATINTFKNPQPGMSAVLNIRAGAGGRNRESDDDFSARIRAHPQTLSKVTAPALDAAVHEVTLGTQAVLAARVVNDFARDIVRCYIDDGTGVGATIGPTVAIVPAGGVGWEYTATGGEIYLRVTKMSAIGGAPDPGFPLVRPGADPDLGGPPAANFVVTSSVHGALVLNTDYFLDEFRGLMVFMDGAGNTRSLAAAEVITVTEATYIGGLVQAAQKVLVGLHPEDTTNFPGESGPAERLRVQSVASTVTVDVTGDLTVEDGYSPDDVIALAKQRVTSYIQTRDVGEAVYLSEIIRIVKSIPGALNFILTAPAADVQPAENSIAKPGNVNIS